MGRQQALQMQYVRFPDISAPAVTAEPETSVKTVTSDQEQHVSEPVRPDMQEITSSSITISGRTHQLPTTKGYLLKEFKDVFTGVGTLPGCSNINFCEIHVSHPARSWQRYQGKTVHKKSCVAGDRRIPCIKHLLVPGNLTVLHLPGPGKSLCSKRP